MGIRLISKKGDFSKTEKFLKKALGKDYIKILEQYGEYGVQALSLYTPIESGRTARSWSYDIKQEDGSVSVVGNREMLESSFQKWKRNIIIQMIYNLRLSSIRFLNLKSVVI